MQGRKFQLTTEQGMYHHQWVAVIHNISTLKRMCLGDSRLTYPGPSTELSVEPSILMALSRENGRKFGNEMGWCHFQGFG
jgi:hypothetical protein